ncbi:MAG: hypothetical protein E7554_10850 [Ruminococcaceae bacterium]|nr:hypothetical protein [Oscillospiraceae bacterium]
MSKLSRTCATAIAICGILAIAAVQLAVVFGTIGKTDDRITLIKVGLCVLQVIWTLSWIFIIRRVMAAEYECTVRVLDEQCDPEAFLEAQRRDYKNACSIRKIDCESRADGVAARINQAVALSFAGRHTEAIGEIDSILAIPVDDSKRSGQRLRCRCHIFRAVFLAGRNGDGDIAAAREHIRKAGEHLRAVGQADGALSGEIIRAGYTVDAVEGRNPEAALEYFGRYLERASVVRTEAACRYQLALIHRQLGDTANERAQLEAVARTAPKAYIGKQAAARLAGLSAE